MPERGRPHRATHQRGRSGPPRRDKPRPEYDPIHLSDEIVGELRATGRPGKAEILIKTFGEAAGAFAAGDLPGAIRLGDQAKHMALRSATVRELLGIAYYRSSKWAEAARELSAFRRLSGTTEQNPVLADAYRALEKPERSVELIDEMEAKGSDPGVYFEGQIVAAGALADMDEVDAAIDRLERLPLRPESPEEHHLRAWYALADLLERRGRFTLAREWFDAVTSVDPELTDAPERARKLAQSD